MKLNVFYQRNWLRQGSNPEKLCISLGRGSNRLHDPTRLQLRYDH